MTNSAEMLNPVEEQVNYNEQANERLSEEFNLAVEKEQPFSPAVLGYYLEQKAQNSPKGPGPLLQSAILAFQERKELSDIIEEESAFLTLQQKWVVFLGGASGRRVGGKVAEYIKVQIPVLSSQRFDSLATSLKKTEDKIKFML